MVSEQKPVNVEYFRDVLKREQEILTSHCAKWREITNLQHVPQNVEGDIFVAIGEYSSNGKHSNRKTWK